MTGKLVGIVLIVAGVVAGAAMYYLQVYAFYERIEPTGQGDVQLTARGAGMPEPVSHEDFRAIDADSSPIRYRACFQTDLDPATLEGVYRPYRGAVPLEAPGWFDCFDADSIGAGLEAGTVRAFLGEKNIEYGIDRVVAVSQDGRGYVWHQINHCGEVVFDGKPTPEDCPEPPEGY
ncbi:DUF6446 family protein [Roseovarius salis]|uniref:DUF6446 family protein n=1 Tax=Roseovarius salis TaxID=3376063 RepID=UPI0037C79439